MSTAKLLDQPPLKTIPLRLQQQIGFILEMDKLKKIMRRSPLLDQSRTENDAEHSWHLAMIAMVLAEYAQPGVDINHVIRMLLVHDIVEIDAGDTFLYDESGLADSKVEREMKAALRLYGLLPKDIEAELLGLWQEFEARETPEALFAAALDKLQPLLHNYFTGGDTWVKYGVTASKVLASKKFIEQVSKPLWQFAEALINDAVARGILEK